MRYRNIDFGWAKDLYQKERKTGSIIKSPRMFGVEFEMVPDKTKFKTGKNVEVLHSATEVILPEAWGSAHDGSITEGAGGVEVQTAPMLLAVGENAIVKFCKDIVDLGWVTDKSCGVHVHLDANDIKNTPDLVRRLFLLYFVMDYSVLAMVPKERRSNIFCSPLDSTKASKLLRHSNRRYDKGWAVDKIISSRPTKKDFLEMFYKKPYDLIPSEIRNHYNEARYHGINFHTLYGNFGTVEVRYLEGTLDSDIIVPWIAFHQHIVDSARLIREVEAIELFHIKGPKTRLRRFAEMTSMPNDTLEWALNRIDKFKE